MVSKSTSHSNYVSKSHAQKMPFKIQILFDLTTLEVIGSTLSPFKIHHGTHFTKECANRDDITNIFSRDQDFANGTGQIPVNAYPDRNFQKDAFCA